jgi:NAD(P)-dependent dehydrogenase (short-subunit alcohol dehydrogenase family)
MVLPLMKQPMSVLREPEVGKLDGKVVVVSGASRGIGKGMAIAMAREGATVYVTGRTVKTGEHTLPGTVGETAEECSRVGGKGVAIACDHGDPEQIAALFDQVRREAGRLDILVNNAFPIPDDLLEPLGFWEKPLSNLEMWDVGIQGNFIAAWHAAQIMVPQKSGLIVSISGYAAVTYTYGVIFSTSKTAAGRMTRDMAVELKPHGVAAVTLWQGLTLTERARENLAKMADKMTASISSQKGSSVEHPGRVITALATDPAIMAKSGGEFITAELAEEYGITDDDGTMVASMRDVRGSPIWTPIG